MALIYEDEENVQMTDVNAPENIENKDSFNDDNPTVTNDEDVYEKAITLMTRAIEQYEDGKFDLARHTRILANKYFAKLDAEMDTEEGREKALYGENLNFGVIYNVIEENIEPMYKDAESRGIIGRMVRLIKEDATLRDEYDLYNALMYPKNVKDSAAYVSEIIDTAKRHSVNEVRSSNRKLLRLVKEWKGFDETIPISDFDMAVFDGMEHITTTPKTISNITEFNGSKNVLSECVKHRNVMTEDDVNVSFNSEDDATADEMKLVKEYNESVDKKAMFEHYKGILESKLTELIAENKGKDTDSENRLTTLLERTQAKTFSEANGLVDIASFIDSVNRIS